MRLKQLLTGLPVRCGAVLFVLVLSTCARERPLAPQPVPEPLVHEPWEDREAEELALGLSKDVVAPRPLYERVKDDLSRIRGQWGDSIPFVREMRYYFPVETSRILVRAQDSVRSLILSGRYRDFDSLNSLFGFASASEAYAGLLQLRFSSRLNSCYLVPLYDRLPGLCEVTVDFRISSNGDAVYASRRGDSILYVFQEGIGYPFPRPGTQYAFRAWSGGVAFIGKKPARADTTGQPHWWQEVNECVADPGPCDRSQMYRRIDWLPPARITDLRVLEPQLGRRAEVLFTTPGNDGVEGSCADVKLAAAFVPLTDDNWNTAPYLRRSLGGGPGDDERVVSIDGLSGTETSYVALRGVDCRGNWAGVSNNIRLVNRWLEGWTAYGANDSPLPSDKITSLRMAPDGALWIGTPAGIASLQHGDWSVYTTTNSGIADNRINVVDIDSRGTLWIGTPEGLSSFDGVQWTSFTPPSGAFPSTTITCLSAGPDDAVWCGLSGALGRFAGGIWTRYEPQAGGLRGASIMAVLADTQGAIWVGTNAGLNRFDGTNWTLYDPTNSAIGGPYVQSIYEDDNGAIFCGSYNGAISRFSQGVWTVTTGSLQLGAASYARAGSAMWVGSTGLSNKGLWRYDGSWTSYTSVVTRLESDAISALATEGDHVLWIGTDGGGLYRWDLEAADLSGAKENTPSEIP